MTLIEKPGFYLSKAGKCEVKYADDEFAFGYDVHRIPCVWYCSTGFAPDARNHDITSIWTDKPKPIEAWAVDYQVNEKDRAQVWFGEDESRARQYKDSIDASRTPRLVHLIEAEGRT